MVRCRQLAVAWVLLALPRTVAGQPEAFVQAAQALAQAAAPATPDPTPLGDAGRLMGTALAEWDRAIEAQEARTGRELREAPPRRQFQLHVEMGTAYRTRGRLADALREFDAAAELDPASSDLQVVRALTLESSGQLE